MSRLLQNGGIGDFFIADSYWTDDKKRDVETFVWTDCRKRAILEPVVRAVPEYANASHVDAPGETDFTPFTHHAVFHRLPFQGSSFLRHTLAEVPFVVPCPYVLIQPSSPLNNDRARRARDMRYCEWSSIVADLRAVGLVGVVVDAPGGLRVPQDLLLLDLTGRTTLAESIELLKRARGYAGVDSCLSVLAAQLFPPECLTIRTQNPYTLKLRKTYYAPHTSFDFLVPSFGENPWVIDPEPEQELTLLRLTTGVITGPLGFAAGELVEVPPTVAQELIGLGYAESATI